MFPRILILVSVFSVTIGFAQDVKFVQEPKVSRKGDGTEISFTVSKASDVAVSILKEGKVVRHLAAGVLGKNAPAPLKPGLSQSLMWDGKDDAGKPVALAGCSVRVGLGLKPTYDRALGWMGEAIGGVSSVAVDEKGLAYVLTNGEAKKPSSVHVFSREGKYLKTIMPYPANLPIERVKGLGHIEVSPNEHAPIIRDPRYQVFYPDWHGLYGLPPQTMCLAGEQLVMSNPWEKYSMDHTKLTNRRLLIIDKDGGVPENYMGPFLANARRPGHVQMAPVPGKKAVYATGLVVKKEWRKLSKSFHVVRKVDLEKKDAIVFLGVLNEPGNDEKHLNDPRGLATDRFGNLYVSDLGNKRIAVFKSDGRFLGKVDMERPGPLAIHQKDNSVYVMNVAVPQFPFRGSRIQKLSPMVDDKGQWIGASSKVLTATKEAKSQYQGYYAMAVDGTAKPTVIWLSLRVGKARGLCRIEEKDDGTFGAPARVRPSGLASGFSSYLAVDREREEVYTNLECSRPGDTKSHFPLVRIDGRTGAMTKMKVNGSNVSVGPDGHIYALSRAKRFGVKTQLLRIDRDGKPAPFPGSDSHVLAESVSTHHGSRGHCVGINGDIYLMYPDLDPKTKAEPAVVDIFGPDGKRKARRRIVGSKYSASIRVDYAGNLYVADNVKPRTSVFPPELMDKLPKQKKWLNDINWYVWYGGVLKFPPAGGRIGGAEGETYTTQYGGKPDVKVDGASWVRTGIYPMPGGGNWLGCTCMSPRFDVDGFGRSFVPDAATYSVRVIDANGNAVLRFGRYGNMDSQGPKSAVPTPEIALAWPQFVAVSHEAAYVSDIVNRRILRVKLKYTSEVTCKLQ